MIKPIELGCAGHLCVSAHCQWKRHTQVGNYRVSTIGAYYQSGNEYEMQTIGAGEDSFYETMVFRTNNEPAKGSENCGCMQIADWGELDCDRYADAGAAQKGHEMYVAKYLKLARKEEKNK